MDYYILCALVFLGAYFVNISLLSVCYHRGFTHSALKLSPILERYVISQGIWMTGLDPLTWCCMHRMHHLYSDTPLDPHSPANHGVFGVLLAQKNAFENTAWGLMRGDETYSQHVPDLNFQVHWLMQKKLVGLVYLLHGLIAVGIGYFFDAKLLGACYFVGLLSHPLQGWLVNSFGHKYGYRNFKIADQSTNNTAVAWLVMGEGYQNNHHKYPASYTFAVKWWEFDGGSIVCKVAERLGLLTITTKPIEPVTPPPLIPIPAP